MNEPTHDPRETVTLRGVRLLRPYGGGLTLVVVLLCGLAAIDMVQPYFLKLLIDDVFTSTDGGGGNWSLLWLILPGMAVIYVGRNALFFVSRMRSARISEDVCFELRKRLFEHLQRMGLRFYRSHQAGKVSARLMDDTFKIQTFVQDKLPTLVRYLLEFQILLIIIYLVNWRLALASTIVLPLHFWTYRRFRSSIKKSHSEAQELLAVAHGNVVEKFLGMEVVKGFSAEEQETRTFKAAIDASRESKIRTQRFHFSQKVVADLLVGLGTVLLLGYGAWEVKTGRMTGGAFFMFFWYVKMLYPAVLEVISGTGHLSRATASVDRVFEMLDEPASERDRGDLARAGDLAGRIEFEHVAFAYEEESPLVLEDVGFVIEPGEHVAITGPSGSGKSTLISLLPRFNEPTRGRVRIDGLPSDEISLRGLRHMFGLVFQEVFLFHASIYENLRYARPEATLEEVTEACRITGAHEFIERLPDGYFTRIGESGGELSRGEKQRITLARALVRNPRVLVLDEATASIDAPLAQEIMQSILELMKGRTVMMVTHDAELLHLVDRVIWLEGGRVAYDGTPEGIDEIETLRLSRDGSPRSSPLRRSPGAIGAPRTTGRSGSERSGPRPPRRRPHRPGPGELATLLLLTLVLAAGCMRTENSQHSLSMGDARVSNGVIVQDSDAIDFDRFSAALDELDLRRHQTAVAAAGVGPAPAGAAMGVSTPARLTLDDTIDLLPPSDLPPDSARLYALPKLSGTELNELVESLALRLNAVKGYADAASFLIDSLPMPPEGVTDARLLARAGDAGMHVIRLGHRRFISQPPQLYVFGVVLNDDADPKPNPDLDWLEPAVTEVMDGVEVMRQDVALQDLDSKLIQLSYVEAPTAMKILAGLGVTTIDDPTKMPNPAVFANLPYVLMIPDPEAGNVGLVGESTLAGGEFGVSLTPSVAAPLSTQMVATPMTQLLVLYHPAHPEQFSRARRLLDEFVDRPARQIFVEGMVLEISEEGLIDLGIEWELNEGPLHVRLGSPSADGQTDTLDADYRNDPDWDWQDFFRWDWSVRIRALIEDGKAEILSRPSVLTINNRQSTIRVGTDIPIATSQEGIAGFSNKIAFTFKYLPTGILMNIRPRINEDGSEVSILIDTIVSNRIPNADLEIRAADGQLLATAPTVSTRRVQTYARIPNSTPLIIGGLVAHVESKVEDKVPILGDIPFLGAAFRSERTFSEKREVIIVLTPYVLPEDNLSRAMPKDDDEFDSFGNQLFRDSYRIRNEDVFDLSFIYENPRLAAYREVTRQVISRNYRLGGEEPFRSFVGQSIPGEGVLVTRMVYEVVKRLGIDEKIDADRLIFVDRINQAGGYDVRFLSQTMQQFGEGLGYAAFFRKHPDTALAVTFYADGADGDGRIAGEAIPVFRPYPCRRDPTRKEWRNLLWELNQPDENGRARSTILLSSEDDLERLRRAVVLKRIVALNGGANILRTTRFRVGTMVMMPELTEGQAHLVDFDTARLFFTTEHYYAESLRQIEENLVALDAALRRPDVSAYLDPEVNLDAMLDAE